MRSNSKKFVTRSLIFFVKKNDFSYARLGFAVSKKVGKAHIRNIYKRIVREGFRSDLMLRSKNYDILVVGKRRSMSKNSKESLLALKADINNSFAKFSSQINNL